MTSKPRRDESKLKYIIEKDGNQRLILLEVLPDGDYMVVCQEDVEDYLTYGSYITAIAFKEYWEIEKEYDDNR